MNNDIHDKNQKLWQTFPSPEFLNSELTTLNVEGAHWRVKREDGQVSLAVEDQVSPHRVDKSPILEQFEAQVHRVDCLKWLKPIKSCNGQILPEKWERKMIEWCVR